VADGRLVGSFILRVILGRQKLDGFLQRLRLPMQQLRFLVILLYFNCWRLYCSLPGLSPSTLYFSMRRRNGD
jgi:hypothetical protein